MTELKDVVHFYIGQNVMRPDGKTILPIFGVDEFCDDWYDKLQFIEGRVSDEWDVT